MRASTWALVIAGLLLAVAALAGCDLVVNGNPQALTGVVGASTCAVTLVVVGFILRRYE